MLHPITCLKYLALFDVEYIQLGSKNMRVMWDFNSTFQKQSTIFISSILPSLKCKYKNYIQHFKKRQVCLKHYIVVKCWNNYNIFLLSQKTKDSKSTRINNRGVGKGQLKKKIVLVFCLLHISPFWKSPSCLSHDSGKFVN